MGILVDSQISELLGSVVVNSSPTLVNPASLDICIGKDIVVMGQNSEGYYCHREEIDQYSALNPYLIFAGERVLASSLEYFNFPIDLAGEFKLKSSVARKFFQHMKAGWIDPGWHGTLTMEFVHFGYEDFPIYPGKPIGQIVFHKLGTLPVQPYQGKYNGQVKAQAAL